MKHTIHHLCSLAFAFAMVIAVILTATHAKDIAGSAVLKIKTTTPLDDGLTRRIDDPVTKALSDLHNHTDKTMVKSLVKNISDNPAALSRRNNEPEAADIASFKTRVVEALLMWRMLFAFALSRVGA